MGGPMKHPSCALGGPDLQTSVGKATQFIREIYISSATSLPLEWEMTVEKLVDEFGEFLRKRACAAGIEGPSMPFPERVERLRAAISHHLIPLLLLARADRIFDASERDVILDHCQALARKHGMPMDVADREALGEYMAVFRPTLMQLAPALAHVARDGREDFADLIATAQRVMDADGARCAGETIFLDRLKARLSEISVT